MSTINLNDSPYLGTVSRPKADLGRSRAECWRCGSSLAGRGEKVWRQTSQGIRYVIETLRCPCGTRRRITRKLAS